MKPNAIFVSLCELYPQLNETGCKPHAAALRNCTCAWWRINPDTASNVKFAFGVYEGKVVSAYRVAVPAAEWPVMPQHAEGAGRRYIPASLLPNDEGGRALKTPINMSFPVQYGTVSFAPDGSIAAVALGVKEPQDAE